MLLMFSGLMGTSKNSFCCERLQSPPAALSGQNVFSMKLSAMPAAILTFRQSRRKFRSFS
jgi:hypothetical protein